MKMELMEKPTILGFATRVSSLVLVIILDSNFTMGHKSQTGVDQVDRQIRLRADTDLDLTKWKILPTGTKILRVTIQERK